MNNHGSEKDEISLQSQWRLIWQHFKRHNLAMIGFIILIILYICGVLFPQFIAPYGKMNEIGISHLPPHKIHFIDQEGKFHFRPFVYKWNQTLDPETWILINKEDMTKRYPIYFFTHGDKYKLWNIIETDIHLFGVQGGQIYLLGTDSNGRDLFSRIVCATRISLTIGFVGVFISLILGLLFGGISGLIGGLTDDIIQRIIEMLMSIPKIPLWMALAAAVPREWSPLTVYFSITIILSFVGWTGMARVIRSKFMSLREEEYVLAAISYNTSKWEIIFKHLIPNFMSYILVSLTLSIPSMIIGETSLSFLGIGLRPPVVSLGVLLESAQSFQNIRMYPWLLTPGLVVIIVVLAYNFVGDGLRDAADPYK